MIPNIPDWEDLFPGEKMVFSGLKHRLKVMQSGPAAVPTPGHSRQGGRTEV